MTNLQMLDRLSTTLIALSNTTYDLVPILPSANGTRPDSAPLLRRLCLEQDYTGIEGKWELTGTGCFVQKLLIELHGLRSRLVFLPFNRYPFDSQSRAVIDLRHNYNSIPIFEFHDFEVLENETRRPKGIYIDLTPQTTESTKLPFYFGACGGCGVLGTTATVQEGLYCGRRDGWTFTPPYSTLLSILGGTNKPKDTAMMRFIGSLYDCGTSDETLVDQIVYYASPKSREPEREKPQEEPESKAARDAASRERNNEQLRQIGLAQGMVEFGRTFSDGKTVNMIETEKSRVVLHELEAGWWILASIDLTILPTTSKTPAIKGKLAEEKQTVEYSSREVKPAILLLGDLLRAHSTFLLHHASSMSALFVRTRRSEFVGILKRYWDTYLSTWNVLMHGNPANNLYGGIKIAACGELGVGVGEEERGSGEREVLEGFVGRIEGLVDVVVSKFGDADRESTHKAETNKSSGEQHRLKQSGPWLGSGDEPAAEDGIIFLGTGALSRKSLRDVSHWIEDLYRWGPYAYGVVDNPSSTRRPKNQKPKAKSPPEKTKQSGAPQKVKQSYGLTIRNKSPQRRPMRQDSTPPTAVEDGSGNNANLVRWPSFTQGQSSYASSESESISSKPFSHYLKLGYGTHWTLGLTSSKNHGISSKQESEADPSSTTSPTSEARKSAIDSSTNTLMYPHDDFTGRFLIGMIGDIDEEDSNVANDPDSITKDDTEPDVYDTKLLLRTLTVEMEREEDARAETGIIVDLGATVTEPVSPSKHTGLEGTGTSHASFESQDRNKTKKLRVVVYVNRPFIFAFLFELRAGALTMSSFYRSLHHQLEPLLKSLINSTTFRASKPELTAEDGSTPIYDLVWDPKLLTVNSTIPNIPDPSQVQAKPKESFPWSRIEALNTHMQLLNTYIAIITDRTAMERTCKTSRGWWIVWTRIPDPNPIHTPAPSKSPRLSPDDSAQSQIFRPIPPTSSLAGSIMGNSLASGPAHPIFEGLNTHLTFPKDTEIFLIRRASDHVASRGAGRFVGGAATGGDSAWASGPSRLAQGIGVDTRKYIEGLLNLNR
ncbi:hypothetical protein B7494_g6677 [Chlorociboria aeruginascens]|nr:hypothetical protein B7494_g6677 [Chlorociboria aeruginascens]